MRLFKKGAKTSESGERDSEGATPNAATPTAPQTAGSQPGVDASAPAAPGTAATAPPAAPGVAPAAPDINNAGAVVPPVPVPPAQPVPQYGAPGPQHVTAPAAAAGVVPAAQPIPQVPATTDATIPPGMPVTMPQPGGAASDGAQITTFAPQADPGTGGNGAKSPTKSKKLFGRKTKGTGAAGTQPQQTDPAAASATPVADKGKKKSRPALRIAVLGLIAIVVLAVVVGVVWRAFGGGGTALSPRQQAQMIQHANAFTVALEEGQVAINEVLGKSASGAFGPQVAEPDPSGLSLLPPGGLSPDVFSELDPGDLEDISGVPGPVSNTASAVDDAAEPHIATMKAEIAQMRRIASNTSGDAEPKADAIVDSARTVVSDIDDTLDALTKGAKTITAEQLKTIEAAVKAYNAAVIAFSEIPT